MNKSIHKSLRAAVKAARAEAARLGKAARRADEVARRKLLEHNIRRLRQGKPPVALASIPAGEAAARARSAADGATRRADEIARLAGAGRKKKSSK
jgi:hypothetical protein